MPRARVTLTEQAPPPEWQDDTRAGVKVRIRGERGQYTVKYESSPPLVTPYALLYGGLAGHESFRTPAADRIVWPRSSTRGAK